MSGKVLAITLFGACHVRSADADAFVLNGAKHKALLVLLATAPHGRRTRTFLQETLWGTACYDTGRQSLRRALSDIRQIMGPAFAEVVLSTNNELTLDLSRVTFVGECGVGTFLEGIDIRETGFSRWLQGMRDNPQALLPLFSTGDAETAVSSLPVVAVMPFRAIGGDGAQATLGDWLAEEICRTLSRSRLVAVISHLSTRMLAQKTIEIGAVKSALQAHYCVAGSLRKSGAELILDADFIETSTGRLLWTRQFVGPAETFLDRSSDGIEMIVQAIGRAIADEAMRYVVNHPLKDVEDHRLLVAGVGLMHRLALSDFARARQILEETIRRAPKAPETHAWLAQWYVLNVFNGWSSDPDADAQSALDQTKRALDISPENTFALSMDGFVHTNLLRRMDIAETRYEKALDINPNESICWLLKGAMQAFQDDGDAAVRSTDTARRLSPMDPFGYFYDSLAATACLSQGDYARALRLAERSLATNDRHLSTLRSQIFALYYLDRADECGPIVETLLRRNPGFTVDNYMRSHPSSGFAFSRRAAEAFKGVGIP